MSAVRNRAVANGWRSGFEERVAEELTVAGVAYSYESLVLEYTMPAKARKYTPDFVITTASGKVIVVETKGLWTVADRQKMVQVVQQNPDIDLRMVFQNPNNKIAKGSKTTYENWARKFLGVPVAAKSIPTEWLLE